MKLTALSVLLTTLKLNVAKEKRNKLLANSGQRTLVSKSWKRVFTLYPIRSDYMKRQGAQFNSTHILQTRTSRCVETELDHFLAARTPRSHSSEQINA